MRAQPDPTIKLQTVFSTNDSGLAGVVTSLLESARIDYSVRGDSIRNVTTSTFGWAEFQVREEDAGPARELLAALTETSNG
jgi:hypothetical protein